MISRDQVEKVWRGEWITKHYVDGILEGTNFDECSKCGYQRVFENPELKTKYMFCPGCGRAMWDEAVEMVMKRLEQRDRRLWKAGQQTETYTSAPSLIASGRSFTRTKRRS